MPHYRKHTDPGVMFNPAVLGHKMKGWGDVTM